MLISEWLMGLAFVEGVDNQAIRITSMIIFVVSFLHRRHLSQIMIFRRPSMSRRFLLIPDAVFILCTTEVKVRVAVLDVGKSACCWVNASCLRSRHWAFFHLRETTAAQGRILPDVT